MKKQYNRRDLLKTAGTLSSFLILDSVLAQTLWIPSASGASVPLESLRTALDPDQALMLVPSDKLYAPMQSTINRRHENIQPQVRVLCKTNEAVAICIQWAKSNNVPLAMRNGGHSYEGFSLSPGLVIDVREMNSIEMNRDASSARIGGGALLGKVYETLSTKGVVIPAGTCPTVGITGHTTGGGYGLLTRPLGLACDSLVSAELVDARGHLLTANENENVDLFWALRGGGSGSFGVITSLQFKTHQISNVTTFIVRWRVDLKEAIQIAALWQHWAPKSPNGITSLLNCTLRSNQIQLTLVGQSITTQNKLKAEIKTNFLDQIQSSPVTYKITAKTFMEAVNQFAGNDTPYYIKGKSDYVKQAHSPEALTEIFSQMPAGVAVIFDAYGGAIRNKTDSETAFAHRENTICSIQYYLQWEEAADTDKNLARLREYYDRLRPHMSGHAYFNYCDLDLGNNYARAYWGSNLEKLVAVKNAYDPDHFFTHAQGIPKKV